jgi:arylsulfatase
MHYMKWHLSAGAAAIALLAGSASLLAAEVLPKADQPFAGVIDPDRNKSKPDWPKAVQAPAGAPNIVLVLLDDVGFGATSVTGGPVNAPALDKLAAEGLRYNQFHVNSLCSPTRAALLSGRNDHETGFGSVASSGYPGYNFLWPKSAKSVAEVLRRNGYSTAAFGKWHNTPQWEISPVGPFDRWPTNLGFEYFYGFQGGADNQWQPRLWRNTIPVEPSATPREGYHFNTDLANDAIKWLHQHDAAAPDKPFFLYFATGAAHTPHQVAPQWIEKYKGKFDQGWDKLREETFARHKAAGVIPANTELTPRPIELPAWDSLSPDEKKLLARQAEVYAGFLEQTDYEVGRVLEAIRQEGKGDNTLVLYIVGDNGASAEGGPNGQDFREADGKPASLATRLSRIDELGSDAVRNHFAAAWAWGLDAPFQWTKQVASHLGGTRDPLVVSWPSKIKEKGTIRGGFHHVTDIAPTIYEATGIKFPEEVDGVKQLPLEGQSFVDSFTDPSAKSRHTVQYFEKVGNRGIYKEGWWAGARHVVPWASQAERAKEIGQHPWELYNLEQDYSQAHDLAAKNPEKLKELVELFDKEAKRNNVYPLAPARDQPPSPLDNTKEVVLREGAERLPAVTLAKFSGKPYALTADIQVPQGGGEGVIVAEGGNGGGFSLYLDKAGHAVYETNAFGTTTGRIVSNGTVPSGTVKIAVEFEPDQPKEAGTGRLFAATGLTQNFAGTVRLSVNGQKVGESHVSASGAPQETLDVGSDLGTPVSPTYAVPFKFTGRIETVKVKLTN